MKKKIILWSDNSNLDQIDIYLKANDFDVEMLNDCESLLGREKKREIEGIILDLSSFKNQGLVLARDVRKVYDCVIMAIGTCESISYQSILYEIGINLYTLKKEIPLIHFFRFKAFYNLVQNQSINSGDLFIFSDGRLVVDEKRVRVTLDEREISLTLTEWNLLIYMVKRAGKMLSRQSIMEEGLDYDYGVYDRLLDSYIRSLRVKLGSSSIIETLRGFGYRFIGELDKVCCAV